MGFERDTPAGGDMRLAVIGAGMSGILSAIKLREAGITDLELYEKAVQLVDLVRSGRCREVSAAHGATRRFDAERVEAARKTVWSTGCHSWYLDDRGIPATWPWTFDHFREQMAAPRLDAYELLG